jgi:hypothetical protein
MNEPLVEVEERINMKMIVGIRNFLFFLYFILGEYL